MTDAMDVVDKEPVLCIRCGTLTVLPPVFQPYLCEQCVKELTHV